MLNISTVNQPRFFILSLFVVFFAFFVLAIAPSSVYAVEPTYQGTQALRSSGANPSYVSGGSTIFDSQNNLYKTGNFRGTVDFDPSSNVDNRTANSGGAYVSKSNSDNSYAWTNVISAVAGGIVIKDIIVDSHGDVFISGSFGATVDFDPGSNTDTRTSTGDALFISKWNADGSYAWTKTTQNLTSGYTSMNSMNIDSSDNIYVTGIFRGNVDFDPSTSVDQKTADNYNTFVTKLNGDSTYAWTKSFELQSSSDTTEARSIALDSQNNFYLLGTWNGSIDFNPDSGTDLRDSSGTFMTKFNADSSYAWTKTIQGTVFGVSLDIDSQDNFYFTGNWSSAEGDVDFNPEAGEDIRTGRGGFISKWNTNTTYAWTRVILSDDSDGNNRVENASLSLDSNDNIHIFGSWVGTVNFNPVLGNAKTGITPFGQNIFYTSYTSNGNYLWTRTAQLTSEPGFVVPSSLEIDLDNEIYLSAYFQGTAEYDSEEEHDVFQSNTSLYVATITKYSIPEIIPNVSPVVGNVSTSINPIAVNSSVSASATFTDADATDTHTAVWDWGDGTTSAGTVTESNGSGSVTNSHTYTTPGTYTITLTVTDNHSASDDNTTTVQVVKQLTALAPANVWVSKGLLNFGVRLDLKAEAYKDSTLVSSGQVNSVQVGSGGYNQATQVNIPFNSFSPVNFASGSALKVRVSVRNACTGSLLNSGTGRLWFNTAQENSRFGATIGNTSSTYYLRNAFALATAVGAGPRQNIDVAAGARCSAFKPFGTWTVTP